MKNMVVVGVSLSARVAAGDCVKKKGHTYISRMVIFKSFCSKEMIKVVFPEASIRSCYVVYSIV